MKKINWDSLIGIGNLIQTATPINQHQQIIKQEIIYEKRKISEYNLKNNDFSIDVDSMPAEDPEITSPGIMQNSGIREDELYKNNYVLGKTNESIFNIIKKSYMQNKFKDIKNKEAIKIMEERFRETINWFKKTRSYQKYQTTKISEIAEHYAFSLMTKEQKKEYLINKYKINDDQNRELKIIKKFEINKNDDQNKSILKIIGAMDKAIQFSSAIILAFAAASILNFLSLNKIGGAFFAGAAVIVSGVAITLKILKDNFNREQYSLENEISKKIKWVNLLKTLNEFFISFRIARGTLKTTLFTNKIFSITMFSIDIILMAIEETLNKNIEIIKNKI